MNTTPVTPENMFWDSVKGLNKAKTPTNLSDELAKVVAAVKETRKPGTLTYTVTVTPWKNHDTAVILSDDVKTKLPQKPRKDIVLYSTPDGMLTATDPDQEEMNFGPKARVIAGEKAAETETVNNTEKLAQ